MNKLITQIIDILDDAKAENIITIDIGKVTTLADYIVICTATSKRHARALSQHLTENLKTPFSNNIQGLDSSEWIVVDLMDVIIHIMLPNIREFYQLEKLWT
jgi:ribosome-associated protein